MKFHISSKGESTVFIASGETPALHASIAALLRSGLQVAAMPVEAMPGTAGEGNCDPVVIDFEITAKPYALHGLVEVVQYQAETITRTIEEAVELLVTAAHIGL